MLRFCFSGHRYHRGWATKVFSAVLGVLTCTASVLAGGGRVLSPDAAPKGYSLSDIAAETAVYNVGEYIGDTEPVPEVPFEVLIDDATVRPGTMLYVPVIFADNAPPLAVSPFPTDLRDSEVDADYLLDVVASDDVEAFIVQVDGKTTVLCDDYAVGVKTVKLPDGGDRYIVSAAFLTPLAPGEHTVGIGGIIDDAPVVFVSYTVTVTGGGKVLPPDATPKGYSLSDMAVETAVYNTGEADGLTEPLPKVPFEVLVPEIADYTVKSGAMLYVPVYYADDSGPPSVPPFPKNISDQDEDADYLADVAYDDFGATDFFVQVDSDEPTILCDDYIVGVKTAALPDGTPAGHDYIVAAAFLTPLTPGDHTIGIGGVIGGEPTVFVSYTVTVKP